MRLLRDLWATALRRTAIVVCLVLLGAAAAAALGRIGVCRSLGDRLHRAGLCASQVLAAAPARSRAAAGGIVAEI
ncbi:hypothetical protein [Allorhizocola rhizosphaerae]|uniref:hypothetical protein n=1 Tax=Allorhizocola rhizosphaerae TaxID=1872709 RepID=UPI000E3EB9FD|nr:hypothetical protein [Allorhizocola rhizosphaerae]